MKTSISKWLLKTITVIAVIGSFASSGPASAGALEDVKARGKMIAGVRYDSSPFGYLDPSGKVVGFDVELITDIARRIGVSIEYVQVTSQNRIPILESGKVDILAATITHTREREKVIDFSIDYAWDGTRLLVKKGSGIRGIADMNSKNRTLTTNQGSIDGVQARKMAPEAKYVDFPEVQQAYLAVKQGVADALVVPFTMLDQYVAKDDSVEIVGEFLNIQSIAFGVRQNDSKWRNTINHMLQDMVKDGTYQAIYSKYFKSPYQRLPDVW